MKKPMTQDEYVRWVWRNQSTWGVRRRLRIIRACLYGAGAVIGILLALLLR